MCSSPSLHSQDIPNLGCEFTGCSPRSCSFPGAWGWQAVEEHRNPPNLHGCSGCCHHSHFEACQAKGVVIVSQISPLWKQQGPGTEAPISACLRLLRTREVTENSPRAKNTVRRDSSQLCDKAIPPHCPDNPPGIRHSQTSAPQSIPQSQRLSLGDVPPPLSQHLAVPEMATCRCY